MACQVTPLWLDVPARAGTRTWSPREKYFSHMRRYCGMVGIHSSYSPDASATSAARSPAHIFAVAG
jgi:hypothetical protein